jgi:hypothetical protein
MTPNGNPPETLDGNPETPVPAYFKDMPQRKRRRTKGTQVADASSDPAAPVAPQKLTPFLIRFTPEEYQRFKGMAEKAGTSMADYVRYSLFQSGVPVQRVGRLAVPLKSSLKADPDLIRQISAIGNLLNQQVRALNLILKSGEPNFNLLKLAIDMSEMEDMLNVLVSQNREAKKSAD